jgi:hypothetical protein
MRILRAGTFDFVKFRKHIASFRRFTQFVCLNAHREKYPSLDLSYAAGRTGGTMTAALNAANEQVCLCMHVRMTACVCFYVCFEYAILTMLLCYFDDASMLF